METFKVAVRAVIIDQQKRIITIKRSETAPARALEWDVPGGILEFGEDPLEGILRETREEVGIEVKEMQLVTAQTVREGDVCWVILTYFGQAHTTEVALSLEHCESQWIAYPEIMQLNLTQTIKQALTTLAHRGELMVSRG